MVYECYPKWKGSLGKIEKIISFPPLSLSLFLSPQQSSLVSLTWKHRHSRAGGTHSEKARKSKNLFVLAQEPSLSIHRPRRILPLANNNITNPEAKREKKKKTLILHLSS